MERLFSILLYMFISILDVEASSLTALTSCLQSAHVPFASPSSANYTSEISTYNLRLAYRPLAIAIPTTTAQVSSTFHCAYSLNLTLQPKSGGHSYAGFSLGGKDGALVISLEAFQTVSLGPAGYPSTVAKVGAGLRLGDLALSLYDQGKRALPHGSCPGVGIGGHATHGGYGLNSRAWGLAMDSIVAMDAVLPNGTITTVTPSSSPNLWFALRGAADSFAIVTAFYMQTQPAPASLVYFSYSWGNPFASGDVSIPTGIFLHLQEFAQNASVIDGRTAFDSYMDGASWSTTGQFQGLLSEFNDMIAPELLRGMPKPVKSKVQAVNWTESLTLLAGNQALRQPAGAGYTLHDTFFAKSLTVPSSGLLTASTLNAFFTYFIQHGSTLPQSGPWYFHTIFDLWGGPGSAINALPSSDSAFHERDNFWTFQFYGYTTGGTKPSGTAFPSAVKPFVQGLSDAIVKAQPGTTFGAYSNYVDDSLTPADAHGMYYGLEGYQRLLALKKVVDPGMIMWNPLAIGT